MASPQIAIVISDTHAGSTVALCPPKMETYEGNQVILNPLQEWFWACWRDMWDRQIPAYIGNSDFVLIINGDATEGIHHHTTQIWSPNKDDHVEAAFNLFEPLAERAAYTLFSSGTECHTKNVEHVLGKRLKAVKDPSTGHSAWDRIRVNIHGTDCAFLHHISTSARTWTEATGLSIYMANEHVESVRAGEPIARVLGFAHRHRYGEFRDSSGMIFVTPPWQALTRHGFKVVSVSRVCTGCEILDWRGKGKGELPATHPIIYRRRFRKG